MALLDKATNIFGPLDSDIKTRITTFLDAPTEENWNNVFSILIRPTRTVWQAVIAADPTFPREKRNHWTRVPDAMLVARAIRQATGTEVTR